MNVYIEEYENRIEELKNEHEEEVRDLANKY